MPVALLTPMITGMRSGSLKFRTALILSFGVNFLFPRQVLFHECFGKNAFNYSPPLQVLVLLAESTLNSYEHLFIIRFHLVFCLFGYLQN